jgi:hypothetical protein
MNSAGLDASHVILWEDVCTDQYCSRYMVGTRGKGEINTGTNHLGFRTVASPGRTAG